MKKMLLSVSLLLAACSGPSEYHRGAVTAPVITPAQPPAVHNGYGAPMPGQPGRRRPQTVGVEVRDPPRETTVSGALQPVASVYPKSLEGSLLEECEPHVDNLFGKYVSRVRSAHTAPKPEYAPKSGPLSKVMREGNLADWLGKLKNMPQHESGSKDWLPLWCARAEVLISCAEWRANHPTKQYRAEEWRDAKQIRKDMSWTKKWCTKVPVETGATAEYLKRLMADNEWTWLRPRK